MDQYPLVALTLLYVYPAPVLDTMSLVDAMINKLIRRFRRRNDRLPAAANRRAVRNTREFT